MEEKVLNFIEKHKMLQVGDQVLVGVSGGPDSIALLHFLHSISKEYKLKIAVAHLNHMIRGADADEDEKFVRDLCQSKGIEFYSRRVKVEQIAEDKKITVEEAGREERYGLFYDVAKKRPIDKIALAHHLDDDVETILMRIIRGTGIKGLRGIPPIREGGIIRPFLPISKEEILDYCDLHGLPSKLDKTNLEAKYHRNKLRLELIPYLEGLNPNLTRGISQLSAISAEYYDFIEMCTGEAVRGLVFEGKVDLEKFQQLHVCLKREVLIELLQRVNAQVSVEYHHIQIILEQLDEKGKTTWTLDMPNGIKVIRQYNELTFEKEAKRVGGQESKEFLYELTPGKVFVFSKIQYCCQIKVLPIDEYKSLNPSKSDNAFDYDATKDSGDQILLRSRKAGDRIEPVGMMGTKKVKDIFIDKKIPASVRWKIPLLCTNNDVIWIVGYHKSRKFQINEDTQRVLLVSFDNYKEATGE